MYRGHFAANGNENSFRLSTQGEYAFAHSVWLNATFLGSWTGNPNFQAHNQTLQFPHPLQEGQHYVLTVLVDNLGLDLNAQVNTDKMKSPRGLLDFTLDTHNKSDITWKITGNLGGEQYHDHTRGPLNEGVMLAERQGHHLPGALAADDAGWETLTKRRSQRFRSRFLCYFF